MLTPYQRWLLTDECQHVAFQKARRIGGSFGVGLKAAAGAAGIKATRDGWVRDPRGPQHQKLISASQLQSNELLGATGVHSEALAMSGAIPRSSWPKSITSRAIELNDGTQIRALPDNPRTARGGESADVTLDEFAFHRDQLGIWMAIKSNADENLRSTTGNNITVVTTPFGEGSLAHRICVGDLDEDGRPTPQDDYAHFSRYRIDLYSAVKHGYPNPLYSREQREAYVEKCRREAGTHDTFLQEYLCSWIASANQYFTLALLNGSRYREVEDELGPADLTPAMRSRARAFVGVDIGRKNHRTAISIILEVDGKLYALRMPDKERVLHRVDYDAQHNAFAKVIGDFNVVRLCIDATGIGSSPSERLAKDFPGIVEPVTFGGAIKEEMATATKLALEQKRLRLPFDRELLYDMAKIRRVITTAHNVRFDATEDGRGHADRAWALMLAVHAAVRPEIVIGAASFDFRSHASDLGSIL